MWYIPAGILGPDDMAVSETTGTIIRHNQREVPIGMQGSFNLCDVRDLARLHSGCRIKAAAARALSSGNEEVTLKELCQMLTVECGCKPIRFYLPLGIANKMAKLMERQAKKKGSR